jgi:hypothetical protein
MAHELSCSTQDNQSFSCLGATYAAGSLLPYLKTGRLISSALVLSDLLGCIRYLKAVTLKNVRIENKVLVGKREIKTRLVRNRSWQVGNIRVRNAESADWINQVQVRVGEGGGVNILRNFSSQGEL